MKQLSILTILSLAFLFSSIAEAGPCDRKGRTYRVRIDSAPPGATVYVGDKSCGISGYTPWEGALPSGTHKIIVELKGYEGTTRSIDVRRTRRVQETFVPLAKKIEPGKIDVLSTADANVTGAEVWLDGQRVGVAPIAVEATEGRHLVEIKKSGFQTISQWVQVKDGSVISMSVVLVPDRGETGSILVNSDVPNSEIYLDGKKYPDTTPAMINAVSVGVHEVEVRGPGASPWKGTVTVMKGQTAKVNALLRGGAGSARVLANVEGAKVFVDGAEMGTAPIDIKGLKAGEHIIEVRAEGYANQEKRITASAGSSEILKFDLAPSESGSAVIKVVSPVPGAEVFIDGAPVGTAPAEKRVSAGEHFVVVQKAGHKKLEEKVTLTTGETKTITAELPEAGALRVISTPAGADVLVDGQIVGQTPLDLEEIASGQHTLSVQLVGYEAYDETITVEGGKRVVVNTKLHEGTRSDEELARERKALTSASAIALPRGRATLDLTVGYPHYLRGDFVVGGGSVGPIRIDAGALIRTNFARTDFAVRSRVTFAEYQPFSAGVFTELGGGTSFSDDGRNAFFWNVGALGSIEALGRMVVTGRAYFNFYSDRHCPSKLAGGGYDGEPIDTCLEYDNGTLDAEDRAEIDLILDGDDLFTRDNGMRFFLGFSVEWALSEKWNVLFQFDIPPLQEERLAYKNLFNGWMFNSDAGTYVRGGLTYKF